MRSFFRRNKNRNGNRFRSTKQHDYGTLEDRRLLAGDASFDALTGELSITLHDNSQTAIVDTSATLVSFDGSFDLDPILAGVQSVLIEDVLAITVHGNNTKTDQAVVFNGNFAGDNSKLMSIKANDLSKVTFNGTYELSDDLYLTLIGTGGFVSDGTTGNITVGGMTVIKSGANPIELNNAGNDLMGTVSIATGGTNQHASLASAGNINFATVAVSGDLTVSANGNITDIAGASINVIGTAGFDAASVTLGDNITDTTNFFRVGFNTSGNAFLQEDSPVILISSDVNNLTIDTNAGIFDGQTTNVNVRGLATLAGASRIRLGESGTDSFNAGMINVNSQGHVHITESSSTEFFGANTAESIHIISQGDLSDAEEASINIITDFAMQAASIRLGDSPEDELNSGTYYFYSLGEVSIDANSSINLIEYKNQASKLTLTTPGTITDHPESAINVDGLATFNAESVNIGDSTTDWFNAGSVEFHTTGQFKMTENSDTIVAQNNNAKSVIINSTANLTNAAGATVDVTDSAAFFGQTSINLGNQALDQFNFGQLITVTPGVATIFEDSSTLFVGNNTSAGLNINSTGAITDGGTAKIDVSGIAKFNGTSIKIGDSLDDRFNAASITVNSQGNVEFTEDSDLNLHGVNTANALTLVATGMILDSLDASTTVATELNVRGTLINLGTSGADFLSMQSLVFNSTLNTNINANSSVNIVKKNKAGDKLLLTSAVNITDAVDAETIVQNAATFTAVDVIIGELSEDCFDVLTGGFAVFASNTNNVIAGCPV